MSQTGQMAYPLKGYRTFVRETERKSVGLEDSEEGKWKEDWKDTRRPKLIYEIFSCRKTFRCYLKFDGKS